MKTEEKLKVLKKIAVAFEEKQILWAVGASALLYFKGMVPDFGDIDIVTTEEEIPKIIAALKGIGLLKPENPANKHKARVYLEYLIDSILVDIMAELIFHKDNREHRFSLKEEKMTDSIMLEGTRIPLQSVQEWRMYYSLMGRTEKVRLIDKNTGRKLYG